MKKVLIIGAGPAGITAGLELVRRSKDVEVTIIEESSIVGGIARTVRCSGNRIDLGGHRFFSKNRSVNEWWEGILPMQGAPACDDKKLNREVPTAPGGPDPDREDRVMLKRNRVVHIFYDQKFFDYPVRMNAAAIRNMGFLTTMSAGFSYLAACVHKQPEVSLENFFINRFGRKLYSMFFEGYTEKLWGRHPRDISADWGAQRVRGLSIRAMIGDVARKALPGRKDAAVDLSSRFSYPKYGPGQMWEQAASMFEEAGGKIVFNCTAKKILRENGRATAVIAEKDGTEQRIDADVVISTMPIRDLVAGMDNVPSEIAEIAEGLPYRDYVTVALLIDRLKLKNETKIAAPGNIVPDCWIYVQDVGVKLGRIQIYNNWSPYMVKDPENTVWIGLEYFCAEGDRYWNMSDAEWVEMGRKELVRIGVLDEDTRLMDSHRESVKKAYPAYFDTYAQIDQLIAYLNQCPNLYCIGRNGQHRYNNMDHSMVTAFEAVENILNGSENDHSAIWNVNTKKEYHEVNTN